MTMSIAAKHAKGKSAQDKFRRLTLLQWQLLPNTARMPLPTLLSALF